MGWTAHTTRTIATFAVGLVCMDVAIAIGLDATTTRSEAKPPAASSAGQPPAEPAAAQPWSLLSSDDLGHRLGSLYRDIRDRLPSGTRVRLSHERAGDDFEIRLELVAVPGKAKQGFPSRVYCLTCPNDRCRFDLETYRALESVAGAIPREPLATLSRAIGAQASEQPKLEVEFIGGASGGRVYRWREEHVCDFGFVATERRDPPAYDHYDGRSCGTGTCEVSATGETIRIEAMDIDSNARLACLRAACLRASSTLASDSSDLSVSLVGEVAIEDGGAGRGASIAIRLAGIASSQHRGYYEDFLRSFVAAARGS